MRQIKFRAWSNKNKCWCYPVLDITNDFNLKNTDSSQEYIFSQFTGLYDCEGKEIYEGDLVKFNIGISSFDDCEIAQEFGKIVFKKGCFIIETEETTRELNEVNDIKVIGNIYEEVKD